jgi:beta-lactamase regulating signal transducer with metallopeptidase domain
MISIGATLLWCAFQVTAVAAAAVSVYLVAFRGGATTRAGVALAGLVTAAVLAPLAFSPWPHWEPRAADAASPSPSAPASDLPASVVTTSAPAQRPSAEAKNVWSAAWNAFLGGLADPQPIPEQAERPPAPVRWPVVIACLFAAAATAGLLRLAVGAWSVRRSIRRARRVYDAALFGLIDVLRAELSCTTPVDIRESAEVATAATAGWRKPVLLLPPDWRGWNETERRAVVAHELAHVKRRDYLAAVAAQAALAVHFYHPLLHWLAGRVRLEQELAADALAASVSGGRAAYLRTLAELALRRSDGRVAWPARAFLPSRHTFLRRIEMLRDPRRAADRPAPLLRAAAAGGLLLFGLVIAGVRPDPAAAQSTPPGGAQLSGNAAGGAQLSGTSGGASASGQQAAAPSVVAYMPATARVVVLANPSTLFRDPAIAPFTADMDKSLAESKDPMTATLREAGVQPRQVESLAVAFAPRGDDRGPEPAGFAIRLSKPVDRAALEKKPTSTNVGGVVYKLADDSVATVPDDRTILLAKDETMLMAMLLGARLNRDTSPWTRIAEKLGAPAAAVMLDSQFLAAEAQKEIGRGGPAVVAFMPVMPLLTDTTYAGVALNLSKEAGIQGYAECKDESAAKRVAETLRALVTLGQNTLRQVKGRTSGNSPDQQAVQMFLPLVEQLLNSAQVQPEGTAVTVSTKASGGTAVALAFILPAVQKAREAARQAQSMNNLKQIALAFHNYHDMYGHFPPAVLEENGVKRSWRVEILPLIDQDALYRQYRKDQPWDSPDNKRVLDQMPAIFKDTADTSGPTSTSYYLLTGSTPIPGARHRNEPVTHLPADQGARSTLFADKPVDAKAGVGPTLLGITDGTSNTILVVEAKRDIPWTKPEDIVFDADKPEQTLKQLGGNHPGGFVAAFADGAVRIISSAVTPANFKALVTPAGGEIVGADTFGPAPQPGGPPGGATPPPAAVNPASP